MILVRNIVKCRTAMFGGSGESVKAQDKGPTKMKVNNEPANLT